MIEVACHMTKLPIDETGVYTIDDIGLHMIHIAKVTKDEVELLDTHTGSTAKPIHGTGLLGIGKTKRALFVSVSKMARDIY
jgi:hypothetical protein